MLTHQGKQIRQQLQQLQPGAHARPMSLCLAVGFPELGPLFCPSFVTGHNKNLAQHRKANNTIHGKTKLARFSRFLRHSARNRGGLILQRSRAQMGQRDNNNVDICMKHNWAILQLDEHDTTASMDWIVQCFTSPPTQYSLYERRFLQVKRPNQQYQSTEGRSKENKNNTKNIIHTEIRNSTR